MTPNQLDSGDHPDHDETPPVDAGISPDDPHNPILGLQEESTPAVEDGKIQSGRLAGKSMWAAIGILAIPVLLQQTLTAFVGLVEVETAAGDSLPAGRSVGASARKFTNELPERNLLGGQNRRYVPSHLLHFRNFTNYYADLKIF